MNWFTFLKSNSGKIAKGPLLGGVATLAGLGITMGGYNHDVATYSNPSRSVSSLRSIEDDSLRDRLEVANNGELTSMSDYLKGSGGDGIRLESPTVGHGRDVESLDSNLAYQFGQGDGLSAGGQDFNTGTVGHYEGGASGAVNPVVAGGQGDPSGQGGNGAHGGNGGGSATTPAALTRGSVAHASGGSGNGSSFGGGMGGATGGNSPYKLSGSMPSSSSMDDLIARHNSSALGGNRNTHSSRFGATGVDRGDRLRRAARFSEKGAARGTQIAANEGGGAFLEGGLSGGVTLTNGSFGSSEGSSSDLNNNVSKINNRLNGLKRNLDDQLKKPDEARKKLFKKILWLLGMTLAASVGMYFLIKFGMKQIKKATTPLGKALGFAMVIAGWAMLAAVAVYAATVVKDAIKFMNDFPDAGKSVPIIGMAMALASVGTLTYVGIRATREASNLEKTSLIKDVKKGASKFVKGAVDKGADIAAAQVANNLTDNLLK